MIVRPARLEDIERLHPESRLLSYRAWACDIDGEPAGVIGIAFTRPQASVFFSCTDALRPHLGSVRMLRVLKRFEAMFKARGLPVLAVREPGEEKAPAMLARLGFRFLREADGEEIHEWRPD